MCVAKKKTKSVRKSLDPLYNQVLVFSESPQGKVVQVRHKPPRAAAYTFKMPPVDKDFIYIDNQTQTLILQTNIPYTSEGGAQAIHVVAVWRPVSICCLSDVLHHHQSLLQRAPSVAALPGKHIFYTALKKAASTSKSQTGLVNVQKTGYHAHH